MKNSSGRNLRYWQDYLTLQTRQLINLVDYKFLGGYSHIPRTVSFNLTYQCNLRCKMCAQWGNSGSLLNTSSESLKQKLSIKELKNVVDQVGYPRPFRPYIYVWGGEPFLHADAIEFLTYIKSKNLTCGVVTNGTVLSKKGMELVKIGLNDLNISLDGPERIHDEIRGSNVYRKVIKGLEVIQDAKEKTGKLLPKINLVFVVMENNYKFLDEMVEIAEEYNVDKLTFAFLTFTNAIVGEAYEKEYKRRFNLSATSWKGWEMDVSGIDCNTLREQIVRILKRKSQVKISFTPPLKVDQIEKYHKDPAYFIHENVCLAPWRWLEISPDGDVVPCHPFPDYVVGNVRKQTVKEIWNSERYRKFRKSLRKDGLFPVCARCCQIHEDRWFKYSAFFSQ